MSSEINKIMRKIPSVDSFLKNERVEKFIEKYGRNLVMYAIRKVISNYRKDILKYAKEISNNEIIDRCENLIRNFAESSLREVINGTGVILHTNLGRSPLGESVLTALKPIVNGYSNLEYSLGKQKRGERDDHISALLEYITKVDKAILVNNNAAAVFLILKTLCEGKEVIISRGELIEIGGSFRIPDIMEASGCEMVEVGATNKTKYSDYENAISENTGAIFKAHKSNYCIKGFSAEVEIDELSVLGKKYDIPVIYDMGSGLLKKPDNLELTDEPDVAAAVESGADIICFSCDKLLGGAQGGVIAGKEDLVTAVAKNPLKRAFRVGKLTMASVVAVLQNYLQEKKLLNNNPAMHLLNRDLKEKKIIAEALKEALLKENIQVRIIESLAKPGGGTLPDSDIKSYAIEFYDLAKPKEMFEKLHYIGKPIISVLKEGKLILDIAAIFERDLDYISKSIIKVWREHGL